MLRKVSIFAAVIFLALAVAPVFAVNYIQAVQNGTGLTEIAVNPSDTFYVDLVWHTDEFTPGLLSAIDAAITVTGPAHLTDYDADDLTFHVQYTGGTNGNGIYNGSVDRGDGTVVLSVTSWSSGAAPGEIVIDHIGIHCDGPGDVTIAVQAAGDIQGISVVDWATDITGLLDTSYVMTIHQVPEPATIGLISLGGLLLKRRKNA